MSDCSFITSIGGGMLGGVASIMIGHILSKGKLKINLHSVDICPPRVYLKESEIMSMRYYTYTKFLEIPENIIDIFRNCEHIETPEEFYHHPAQYISFLLEQLRDSQRTIVINKKMPSVTKHLKSLLNQDLLEEFFNEWYKYQKTLWIRLLVGHIKGKFDIEFSPPKNKSPLHKIIQSDDGNYLVNFGKYELLFPWTITPMKKTSQPFAEKVSNIFAYEDKKKLKKLIKFLSTVHWDDPHIKKAIDTIQKELHKFSKITIKGILINTGRTAISVSGKGKLVILSKGFKYKEKEKIKEVNKNLEIDISIMENNLIEEKGTIIIKGGEAVTFEAHSNKYLYELPPEVEQIYDKERKCYVKFTQLDNQKTIKSVSILFRKI